MGDVDCCLRRFLNSQPMMMLFIYFSSSLYSSRLGFSREKSGSLAVFTKEVDGERSGKLELNSFFNFGKERKTRIRREVCCDMHVIKA